MKDSKTEIKLNKHSDKETYLHMVLPSAEDSEESENKSNLNEATTLKGVKKQVYYEVGCKVIELNKIYK